MSRKRLLSIIKILIVTGLIIVSIKLYMINQYFSSLPLQNISHKQANIDGLTIHYKVAGNPVSPELVFFHGWGAWERYPIVGLGIDGVIAALSEKFYVIAPEHPGLIRSDPPSEIWSFQEYADFYHKFLLSLEIKQPIIIGQSYGGGIAATYASLHPNNVSRLVLVDSVVGPRGNDWFSRISIWWAEKFTEILKSEKFPFFIKQFSARFYLGVPRKKLTPENIEQYSKMGQINKRDDFFVDFSLLPMPITFLWGKEDNGGRTSISRAEVVYKSVKNPASFLRVEGGHTILFWKPKETSQLITNEIY